MVATAVQMSSETAMRGTVNAARIGAAISEA